MGGFIYLSPMLLLPFLDLRSNVQNPRPRTGDLLTCPPLCISFIPLLTFPHGVYCSWIDEFSEECVSPSLFLFSLPPFIQLFRI